MGAMRERREDDAAVDAFGWEGEAGAELLGDEARAAS
jgi:hypothetical protein